MKFTEQMTDRRMLGTSIKKQASQCKTRHTLIIDSDEPDYLCMSENKVKEIISNAFADNSTTLLRGTPELLRPLDRLERDYVKRYNELSEKWKDEICHFSTNVDMFFHPKYQQIIGMGPKIIPLLLNELKNPSVHWFWALNSITGEDPVPQEKKGDISEMAKSWLKWGEKKGYDI
ncbi:MAG: hypothetical protein OEV87_08900 [Phycisphaerae bacterium]|nr:hypothetical protein [Phycisphaerae bacterium]